MPVYFRLFMLFNTREPENGNRDSRNLVGDLFLY